MLGTSQSPSHWVESTVLSLRSKSLWETDIQPPQRDAKGAKESYVQSSILYRSGMRTLSVVAGENHFTLEKQAEGG